MFVITHRMGRITYRIEADVPLPRLDEGHFANFRVGDDELPDVRYRFHRIETASLEPDFPKGEEEEQLLQGVRLEPGGLANPILRSLQVQDWLRNNQGQPGMLVQVQPDRMIGYDFSRQGIDFFYPDTFGQKEQENTPRRMGPDGRPVPRFYIRKASLDPQANACLPTEERERFLREVEFISPDLIDLPTLCAPEVRTWLRASLEHAEKVIIDKYMDGLIVWNQHQNTLNFFFIPEYGDTPEGYLAVSFRHLFATFLPQFSALMVHSSGLIRNGRAALFLAPDSGGKSTVLKCSDGEQLLNDDQIIVRREGEGFVAYATPLGRLTSGPGQAPLGGLFVLEKAGAFELEPVAPAGLVKRLWEEHNIYTSLLPKALKLRAFDLFYDLCHRVPAYKMRFPRDRVDWGAVEAAMGV